MNYEYDALYCEVLVVFYLENLNGRAIFLIFDHKTPSGNQSEQKTYKAIASPTPAPRLLESNECSMIKY